MRDVQLNGEGRIIAPMKAERLNPNTPVAASQQDESVYLEDLLGVLWRRLWVIALIAAVLTVSAVGFDLLRTPIYEAEIKMLVGQEQIENAGNLGNNVTGLQDITRTMAEVLPTRTTANAVIEQLDLDMTSEELLANMSVERAGETQVINVSYRDPDPERAQQVANAIGAVFSGQVSEVNPSTNAVTATVWEAAVLPESPVSPNPMRDGLLALVLGVMLGASLAFLLEALDDRWRSPEEIEQVSGVPNFGVIRMFETAKRRTRGEKKGERSMRMSRGRRRQRTRGEKKGED